MLQQNDLMKAENLQPRVRVHSRRVYEFIPGAGPVGLLTTALLRFSERYALHLYEKRRDYTRTRTVQLAPYLVADSVADYTWRRVLLQRLK